MATSDSKYLLPGYTHNKGSSSVLEPSSEFLGFEVNETALKTQSLGNLISTALEDLDSMFNFGSQEQPFDKAEEYAMVDVHLKKAIVNHIMGKVDNQLSNQSDNIYSLQAKVYDSNIEQARRLANVVKPQLKLIQELHNYIRNIESIRDNPEYDMCYRKLSSTLNWLVQESEGDIQTLLNVVNTPEFGSSKSSYKPVPASKVLNQSGFLKQPGIKVYRGQGGGRGRGRRRGKSHSRSWSKSRNRF